MTNLGARVVTQEIPGKGNMEHISARTHPLIRTRLRLEIPRVLKHLTTLPNLVHDGVVRRHELPARLVVRSDAVHDTRERALSEVIAHEIIQLRGDDAQALLPDMNSSIEIARELHAAFIQRVRAVHDALSERHGARVVMLHSAEHFYYYAIINGAGRPTAAAPARMYGIAATPAL